MIASCFRFQTRWFISKGESKATGIAYSLQLRVMVTYNELTARCCLVAAAQGWAAAAVCRRIDKARDQAILSHVLCIKMHWNLLFSH